MLNGGGGEADPFWPRIFELAGGKAATIVILPTASERALAAARQEGEKRWGPDAAAWPYAGMHRLELEHNLGAAPLVGRHFNRGPFPLEGSSTTVMAFGGPWEGDELDVEYGASMRLVNDLGDPDRAVSILPGGQSGHPWDPHYDDQLPLYLRLETRPVPWTDGAIEKATVSKPRLMPAQ